MQPRRPAKRRVKACRRRHPCLARTYGEDAIEALVSIMGNAKTPPAARVAAAIAVLDRGHGKPSQRMDVAGGLTLEALIMARINPDRQRAYGDKND